MYRKFLPAPSWYFVANRTTGAADAAHPSVTPLVGWALKDDGSVVCLLPVNAQQHGTRMHDGRLVIEACLDAGTLKHMSQLSSHNEQNVLDEKPSELERLLAARPYWRVN